MIVHDTQRFMAERMHARVRSYPVDYAPIVTVPRLVVDIKYARPLEWRSATDGFGC
jgi:hypothetical protein